MTARQRERERTPISHGGDYASMIQEEHYAREPIEAKYFKFRLLFLLRSKEDLNS